MADLVPRLRKRAAQLAARISPPARSAAAFLVAFVILTLLPYVPSLVAPVPVSPLFPLQVEVLVLVSVAAGTARTQWAPVGRVVASTGVLALLLYQAYDAIVYTAFRRSGLLYEDLRFVVDLAYLTVENVSWETAGGLALALGSTALVGWGVPACIRTVSRHGASRTCRVCLLAAHLVAWPVVLVVAPMQEWGPVNLTYQTTSEQTRVRTVSAKMVENTKASLRLDALLDSLGQAPVDSTYFDYADVRLRSKPHVFVYMIESYGEVLARHPDLTAPARRMSDRMDASLQADGWHVASAMSDVAVRGGRSWLAIASAMLGTRVEHQLLYERFLAGTADPPHLVDFFRDRGYQTLTLQPYMIERPGLPLSNPYGFEVELYRDDLGYEGPGYGWGVVPMPDQYSLTVAHDRVFNSNPKPQNSQPKTQNPEPPTFLFFETVYSHALWNYGLPPVLDDGRAFNTAPSDSLSEAEIRERLSNRALPSDLLPDSLTTPRIFDQPTAVRYLRHVAYELDVLRQYLKTEAPPNSLVIVLGDHQPPLLPVETFGVPVHVLSRDASLVAPFRQQRFADGWTIHPDEARPDAVRLTHESLFSRLTHALADTSQTPALPILPNGVSPSILAR